jgi:L-ribulose-5-phosphate 3-epimerase
MYLGYNTNGFAHHRIEDTISILADLGYRGIALTVDYGVLNPFETNWESEADRVAKLLERHQMKCVIETGARFLLDPRRKHQPTLLSPLKHERDVRIDFLIRCIHLAKKLNSELISFWSGSALDEASDDVQYECLHESMKPVLEHAQTQQIKLAFEPEPGMFIDTMASFEILYHRIQNPHFGLTLDIGHLQCLNELPISDVILKWHPLIWNIHIEDMRTGIHDHLRFGEGDIDFADVFSALHQTSYPGGIFVELSRHSHDAVKTAGFSQLFLSKWHRFNANMLVD